MTRTHDEHIAWCKQRALEYLDESDLINAYSSMVSDLNKHDDTAVSPSNLLVKLGISYVANRDAANLRKWIEGFR